MKVSACGIYARISRDDGGQALGVARQLEDCEKEAARRGWPVVRRYVDNDVSASSGRVRPEYVAMLEDIREGRTDAVIVWDVDRLTRTPAELETFIELTDRHGVALASIGGDVDLATPQGRLTARIKGSVARHEVEQQSRRLKRKFEANAAAGIPHGVVPYGYRREYVTDPATGNRTHRDVIVPEEAAHIREWYSRVIAGETLRSIGKDAQAAGLRARRGGRWDGAMIGRLLRRPLYAGVRVHRGEEVGPGNWEPIVDRDTFDRANAVLRDPARAPGRGPEPRYLGSGLYLCGRCGDGLRPVVQAKANPNHRDPAYHCVSCMRLSRKMAPVDEVVEAVLVARLSREDAALDLSPDPGMWREATDRREAVMARLDEAADQFAEGAISGRQLARITARLEADLERVNRELQSLGGSGVLRGMTGAGAAEAWEGATLDRRRAILRELMTVTVLPVGPGVKFSPEHVQIEWKRAADDA